MITKYTLSDAPHSIREKIRSLTSGRRVSPLQLRHEKKIAELNKKSDAIYVRKKASLDEVARLCPHPVESIICDYQYVEDDWSRQSTTYTTYKCGRCNRMLLDEKDHGGW